MAGKLRVSDGGVAVAGSVGERQGVRKGGRERAWAEGRRGRILGRGRLDDRPQVAQRLELVGAFHATFELDGYGLRNGALAGGRVDSARRTKHASGPGRVHTPLEVFIVTVPSPCWSCVTGSSLWWCERFGERGWQVQGGRRAWKKRWPLTMFCRRSSARLWISVSVSSVIFHLEVDCRLARVEAGMTSTATSLMEVSPSLACLTNMLGAGSVICSVVVVGVSVTKLNWWVIVDEDSPAASAATGRSNLLW